MVNIPPGVRTIKWLKAKDKESLGHQTANVTRTTGRESPLQLLCLPRENSSVKKEAPEWVLYITNYELYSREMIYIW